MITGIDHTVVVSETLADAALTAARLGFRTTPAAHHPFGTANTLVQLGDTYLEYLAILDESLFPEERPDAFSFPSFNRDFLIGEGAGLSMLALKTDDPEALAARLAEVGLSRYPTFSFRRTAQAPDGAELPVSFTLAFASHADFVRAGLFALVSVGAIAAVSYAGLPDWVPVSRPTFAMEEPDLVLEFPASKQDRRTLPDGSEYFGVAGEIKNVGRETKTVPPVLIVLYDSRNRKVYNWEILPRQGRLQPGETLSINEAITDLPKSARFAEIGWSPS